MSNGFYCGGLKAQMLPLAQGNALGGAYALINTFGILAAEPPKCHAPLARNLARDAPAWRFFNCYALGARGIFAPSAQKCRMY